MRTSISNGNNYDVSTIYNLQIRTFEDTHFAEDIRHLCRELPSMCRIRKCHLIVKFNPVSFLPHV